MLHGTVVPDRYSVRLPVKSHLELDTVLDVVVKELKKILGFVELESIQIRGKGLIDEESLPSCQRVGSNDRVRANMGASRFVVANESRKASVDASLAGEELLHVWRELIVGSIHVRKESVSCL